MVVVSAMILLMFTSASALFWTLAYSRLLIFTTALSGRLPSTSSDRYQE